VRSLRVNLSTNDVQCDYCATQRRCIPRCGYLEVGTIEMLTFENAKNEGRFSLECWVFTTRDAEAKNQDVKEFVRTFIVRHVLA